MSQLEATTSAPVNNDVEETREKKRMRTLEPEGKLLSAIHSEKYWFDDGNVILHVENRLFRVHRGVLARHSSAFNDMIPVLQPDQKEQKETMIAGCQVARLPHDKAEDWERVFAVIYDLDGAYKFKENGSIELLVSLLRLGKKYRFEAILDEVMQRLRHIIPTTLEAWTGFPKQFRHSMNQLYELTQAVLEAGHETLLPTLFFLCAAFPQDGTGAILMLCRETGIPLTTLETLLVGRERIVAAFSELQFTSLFGTGASDNINNQLPLCRRRPICQPARQNYYLKYIVLEPRVYLALKPGSEVVNMSALADVCKGCKQDIVAAQDDRRQVMWDRIPKFFDLPDWNDLEDS